jgi:hypothetical protein
MTTEHLYEAALQELHRIEEGTSAIELIAGDILLGDVQYHTGNGWIFVVFSDAGEWDYIHSMTTPSGEHLRLWPVQEKDESDLMLKLQNYHPPDEQAKTIWGFLG